MSSAIRGRLAFGFQSLTAVGLRLRMWSWVLTVLLALTLVPTERAWADCDVGDVLNAMKAGVETAQICQPVCEDKYRCYGAAALAIVLTEISRRKGQQHVDSFCNAVKGTLEEILGDLKLIGDLTDDQISELSDAMKGLGDVIAVVNCACKTEQLQLQNEASFGECANKMLEGIGCGEIDWTTATVGGCDPIGGWIGDRVNDGVDWIVNLGCGWLYDCADAAAGPVTSQCVAGTQADQQGKCHYCSEFGPHFITQADGLCGCEWPYSAQRIGKRVIACQCKPPRVIIDGSCQCAPGQMQLGDGTCACPLGSHQAENDPTQCISDIATCDASAGEVPDPNTNGKTCKKCSATQRVATGYPIYNYFCEDCSFGQKVTADRKSCIAACAPGEIMGGITFGKDQTPDPSAYQCQTCSENTYASYENAGSSKGMCLPCADGTFSKAGATQCLALNCGPGEYQDPGNPHACKSCPPTQIYIPAEKQITTVPGTQPGQQASAQLVPGHCGCGENQKLQGDTCVCAAGATKVNLPQAGASVFACVCPTGAYLDQATFACTCPAGAKLDPTKNACLCPPGQRLEGNKCVLPSAQLVVPPKNCSTLGPRYINDPKNPAACRRCPAGRVANAERNACVAAPRAARPAIAPPPAARTPGPALRCPPGMVPNEAGTTCIGLRRPRQVAPPVFQRPPVRRVIPGSGSRAP